MKQKGLKSLKPSWKCDAPLLNPSYTFWLSVKLFKEANGPLAKIFLATNGTPAKAKEGTNGPSTEIIIGYFNFQYRIYLCTEDTNNVIEIKSNKLLPDNCDMINYDFRVNILSSF